MSGLLIAGAIFGGVAGKGSGNRQKNLADRESELNWLATQEEVRRMEEEHGQIIGQARADVGASGFTSSSQSQQAVIDNTEREMARARQITLALGAERQKLDRAASKGLVYNSTIKGASSGASMGSSMGSWFS